MENVNLKLARYDVAVFEPDKLDSQLKIAWGSTVVGKNDFYEGVVGRFEQDAKEAYRDLPNGLIPAFKCLDPMADSKMTLEDFAREPQFVPELMAKSLAEAGVVIPPEQKRFFVDTTHYRIRRGVPGTLEELKEYHDGLNQNAEVFFINAASCLNRKELAELARTAAVDFPRFDKALWLVTCSKYDAVPELNEIITQKNGGRPFVWTDNPSEIDKRIRLGTPHKVLTGGSITGKAMGEAYNLIRRRLEYIRANNEPEYPNLNKHDTTRITLLPKDKPSKGGVNKHESTRFKPF